MAARGSWSSLKLLALTVYCDGRPHEEPLLIAIVIEHVLGDAL